MIRIGQLLKDAREKRGLSLEQVAAKTKIHVSKLSAIEAGDQKALPARVFSIGLIKSYAKELKVDMKVIDDLCHEVYANEAPILKPEPTQAQAKEEPVPSQPVGRFQVPKTIAILFSLGLIAALFFIIFIVVQKMNSYSEEATIPPSEISQPTETPETSPTTASTPAITPSGEPKPTEAVSPSPSTVTTTPPAPAEVKPEETKTPPPEAIAKPGEPKEERKADALVSPAAKPAPAPVQDDLPSETESPAGTPVANNKLNILAHEPVRVEILWSDGFVQTILLKSQESKTFVFSSRIVVRVNNGGAVKVSYNDAEPKVPGAFNQAIELKYP